MATIKDLAQRSPALTSGHRMCAGCTAPVIVKLISLASQKPLVVCCATGCLEVATTIFPFTAWKVPFIHNAFENAASTMSGVETAYRALKKQGKLADDINLVAFGGDGGTYDIGFQALSGAMERGHNFTYICYTNEAYMNCLSTSSMIMTEDGLRQITKIKEGDQVYAFDQKTHQLVLKECTGVFDNGVKDVYELSTLHHSIKATSNHPFLILKRDGREDKFIWRTLADIKPG
ncbi:MAG: thiamine pyrophosphate-dependent enzyme, partial [Candidatus Omnitrophota bacterium]